VLSSSLSPSLPLSSLSSVVIVVRGRHRRRHHYVKPFADAHVFFPSSKRSRSATTRRPRGATCQCATTLAARTDATIQAWQISGSCLLHLLRHFRFLRFTTPLVSPLYSPPPLLCICIRRLRCRLRLLRPPFVGVVGCGIVVIFGFVVVFVFFVHFACSVCVVVCVFFVVFLFFVFFYFFVCFPILSVIILSDCPSSSATK